MSSSPTSFKSLNIPISVLSVLSPNDNFLVHLFTAGSAFQFHAWNNQMQKQEEAHHNVKKYWENGLSNFSAVTENLLGAWPHNIIKGFRESEGIRAKNKKQNKNIKDD